jgi:hypothetical protein
LQNNKWNFQPQLKTLAEGVNSLITSKDISKGYPLLLTELGQAVAEMLEKEFKFPMQRGLPVAPVVKQEEKTAEQQEQQVKQEQPDQAEPAEHPPAEDEDQYDQDEEDDKHNPYYKELEAREKQKEKRRLSKKADDPADRESAAKRPRFEEAVWSGDEAAGEEPDTENDEEPKLKLEGAVEEEEQKQERKQKQHEHKQHQKQDEEVVVIDDDDDEVEIIDIDT